MLEVTTSGSRCASYLLSAPGGTTCQTYIIKMKGVRACLPEGCVCLPEGCKFLDMSHARQQRGIKLQAELMLFILIVADEHDGPYLTLRKYSSALFGGPLSKSGSPDTGSAL